MKYLTDKEENDIYRGIGLVQAAETMAADENLKMVLSAAVTVIGNAMEGEGE